MSVNWQDSTSPARLKAIAAAKVSGEFDPAVPTWRNYADLRESLIYALLVTGFPPRSAWAITEGNWQELFKRLHMVERVGGCRRVYNNGNRASREVFFTPEEVKSMIGLEVNAGNKSDTEFKRYLWDNLNDCASQALRLHTDPSVRLIDDPYYYERLYEPQK